MKIHNFLFHFTIFLLVTIFTGLFMEIITANKEFVSNLIRPTGVFMVYGIIEFTALFIWRKLRKRKFETILYTGSISFLSFYICYLNLYIFPKGISYLFCFQNSIIKQTLYFIEILYFIFSPIIISDELIYFFIRKDKLYWFTIKSEGDEKG